MKGLLGILSILLLGCSSGVNRSNVSFKTLSSGQNSSIENKEYLLIEDNEAYIEVIEKLNIDESDFNNLLNVDFKSNNVCILFLGQRNTGGYAIEVDYLIKKQKTLYIKTKEISPEKHSNVITVITNPYCIITIPKIQSIVLK
ncbi:protease complex subunit PrcB family protein [Flavobacterium sp.]|jgi:hypothetical protein|uniref:protease complex subunit PrcB family protein n=1 Tax=Flavobacterium sp. TaxID=239 RepID=UPI003D2E5C96